MALIEPQDPICLVEALLCAVLAPPEKNVSTENLMTIFASTGVLNSIALSSLHLKAHSIRVHLNTSILVPAPLTTWAIFPHTHTGIGQIAEAARTFIASVSEVLTTLVSQKIKVSRVYQPFYSTI